MSSYPGVPPSERSPLSENEQLLWNSSVLYLTVDYQELDPIEQAVEDHRLGQAYDLMHSDLDVDPERGAEFLAQVGHEYILRPNELDIALEIHRDRSLRERHQ